MNIPENTETIDGEKLERQLWADIKAQNWTSVENRIAPEFQSVHEDGMRDREKEIKLIKCLNLGDYSLSDFKSTKNGPVIVVSYSASVEETIEGQHLSTKPSERLSVWLKTEKGWQWITHANLNRMRH